MTAYVTDQI